MTKQAQYSRIGGLVRTREATIGYQRRGVAQSCSGYGSSRAYNT